MGFSTIKDYVDKFNSGNNAVSSWQKICLGAAYPATVGRWYDMSVLTGDPPANHYPTLNSTALKATTLTDSLEGTVWHGGNVSPKTKHLQRASAWTTSATVVPSVVMICDYLMYYPFIQMDTATNVQTLDNTDVSLPRYTDGVGVMMSLVTTRDCGPFTSSMIINYQNHLGTDQQIAGGMVSVPLATSYPLNLLASSYAGSLVHSATGAGYFAPFIPLCPGDIGVRKVNSIQVLTGMGGGDAALLLLRPLAWVPIVSISVVSERDYWVNLPSLPRIYDGAFINMMLFAGAAVPAGSLVQGYMEFIYG